MLLRSDDGGITWREVLEPLYGSSVLFASFVENGEGWLMTGWTIEAVDQLTLYHSTDYGNTWQELSTVPRWQWYGYPARMQFLNRQHGEIDMVYVGGAPNTDRIAKLTTEDGGATWTEASAIPLISDAIDTLNNYQTYCLIDKSRRDKTTAYGFWTIKVGKVHMAYTRNHLKMKVGISSASFPVNFSMKMGISC